MKIRRQSRFTGIITVFLLSLIGIYFILSNLNENIVFYYPPSEIERISLTRSKIRVGGIVKVGSVIESTRGSVTFAITDNKADIQIEYNGVLPMLFREKQGVIAEGMLISSNLFKANRLLTKHDENYLPPQKNE